MNHVRDNMLFILVLAILGFFAQSAIDTLSGVMDSPRVEVTCASGQAIYQDFVLVVSLKRDSTAVRNYNHRGQPLRPYFWAPPKAHDLWVEDCVQEIAAAAQQ